MMMPHDNEAAAELASLYVSGAMAEEEARVFETHLDRCEFCRAALRSLDDAVDSLLGALPPASPGDHIWQALAGRIEAESGGRPLAAEARPSSDALHHDDATQVWRHWHDDADPEMVVRRGGDGSWESTAIAGIDVRRLFVDRVRNQVTMLVRMAPGTAYPRHEHGGPEECYVVQGDLQVGDEFDLRAGDYQRVAGGSRHAVQSTRGGCVLLIVSSLDDKLID